MISYLLKRKGLSLLVACTLIVVAFYVLSPQHRRPTYSIGTSEHSRADRKANNELNISQIDVDQIIASANIFQEKTQTTENIDVRSTTTSVTLFPDFTSQTLSPQLELSTLVRIFNSKEMSLNLSVAENKCVSLKIRSDLKSPICVYDKEIDHYISGSLLSSGTWEGGQMAMVVRLLEANKQVDFLDLGCNIGVYTILAAKMNHRVVSVDPMRKNLMLLSRSLEIGKLDSNVTLLWNAVGDKVQNVTIHEYQGNVGGTFVKAESDKGEKEIIDELHRAVAVTLDHLIPLFGNKPVFIKMDIETYEWNALKGGNDFFRSNDVRFVFMEWVAHKNKPSANDIINFMSKFHLVPHQDDNVGTRLQLKSNATWPGEIMWMKSKD